MSELLLAILSGVGFPLLVLVAKRHYESNPNAWEEVAVFALIGAAAMAAGIWVISMGAFEDGSWGRVLVLIPAGWSMFFGLMLLVVAGSQARDVVQKTRKEG